MIESISLNFIEVYKSFKFTENIINRTGFTKIHHINCRSNAQLDFKQIKSPIILNYLNIYGSIKIYTMSNFRKLILSKKELLRYYNAPKKKLEFSLNHMRLEFTYNNLLSMVQLLEKSNEMKADMIKCNALRYRYLRKHNLSTAFQELGNRSITPISFLLVFWGTFISYLNDLFTGYYSSVAKILRNSLVTILLYSAFNFRYYTEIYSTSLNDGIMTKIINSLYFSITSFTTIGYGDLVYDNDILRLISSFEGLLGILFTGLFVTVIARRY